MNPQDSEKYFLNSELSLLYSKYFGKSFCVTCVLFMIPRKTVRHEQVSRIQDLFQLDDKVSLGVLSATESQDFGYFYCASQRYYLIDIDIDTIF